MLLVYTHKITPRLRYTFKHIVKRILGVPVSFTSKVEEFIAHDSIKMSYTKQPLSSEIFVRSNELLFEQGLSDIPINIQDWDATIGFFVTSEKSSLPYDIFAASFYLLSRYEEYLPQVRDEYGRFLATESLAYKNDFLQQPVVDIWAYKLKAVLLEKFPKFTFPKQRYKINPVIDVPMAYYFSNKGLLRTVGGTLGDLGRLKLKRLYQRFSTLTGFKRDPHDTFKWIITKQKQHNFKFIVFFLVGNYTTYDKNISINKKKFVSLIKSVADYCDVGLKASYLALNDLKILINEKKKLESVINYNVDASRNSHSKINLPEAYRNLIELEIYKDYTMGYINELGFRASTCTPFQFYDLDFEIETPLQINAFHCFDYSLLKHKSQLDKKEKIQALMQTIKQVNGTFVPVFHNYSLSNEEPWDGFKDLFNIILESKDET
ncbi:polysaccharide deacetylase family protein [Ichthyenterobacterium sp. W332]|uniref:Polysaccharide deacetylase family protein n=1 Tax=Microcosmobacter mediterraneus TaxID=3075607 RepID=A0ABU2YKI6_9FLAO|nr:polysaccharide deacetylase family protein [Ichthyenterobacterium sp. W332]MDT0558401.1 polysaccharide deacetylase family protein [Ichthyenterobacterium sp. W332]